MFWEKPPPPLDSFLQNSFESVSLNWNCLWYFFQKESNVGCSIVWCYGATVHQCDSLSGNLTPSLVLSVELFSSCVRKMLLCTSEWSQSLTQLKQRQWWNQHKEVFIELWFRCFNFSVDRRIGLHQRSLSPEKPLPPYWLFREFGSNIKHTVLCSLPFPASPRHFNLVFFSPPSQDFERVKRFFWASLIICCSACLYGWHKMANLHNTWAWLFAERWNVVFTILGLPEKTGPLAPLLCWSVYFQIAPSHFIFSLEPFGGT